jgi:hypothetical protein
MVLGVLAPVGKRCRRAASEQLALSGTRPQVLKLGLAGGGATRAEHASRPPEGWRRLAVVEQRAVRW